jgi:hypothetical protein
MSGQAQHRRQQRGPGFEEHGACAASPRENCCLRDDGTKGVAHGCRQRPPGNCEVAAGPARRAGLQLDAAAAVIHCCVQVNAQNAQKNTPLHWACLNGHLEGGLVGRGCRWEARLGSFAAVCSPVAKLLVEHKADPTLTNAFGRSGEHTGPPLAQLWLGGWLLVGWLSALHSHD